MLHIALVAGLAPFLAACRLLVGVVRNLPRRVLDVLLARGVVGDGERLRLVSQAKDETVEVRDITWLDATFELGAVVAHRARDLVLAAVGDGGGLRPLQLYFPLVGENHLQDLAASHH